MDKGLREKITSIEKEVSKASNLAGMVLDELIGSMPTSDDAPKGSAPKGSEGIIGQSHLIHTELMGLNEKLRGLYNLLVGPPKPPQQRGLDSDREGIGV